MTLIAFRTDVDHAEVVTDSISYALSGRHVWRENPSKVQPLSPFDAVTVVQGSQRFGDRWNRVARRRLAPQSADFDAYLDTVDTHIEEMWRQVGTAAGIDLSGRDLEAAVFHVGYSPAAGRFIATMHASDLGFDRIELDGTYAQPAPFSHRPGPLEHAWTVDRLTGDPLGEKVIEAWTARPPLPAVTETGQWIELARMMRTDRSFCSLKIGRILTGGELLYTRLGAGACDTHPIANLDDDGRHYEQLAEMLHPMAQLGPCPECDSGALWADCCLPKDAGEPCWCSSGRTLADCCSIHNDDALDGCEACTELRNEPSTADDVHIRTLQEA